MQARVIEPAVSGRDDKTKETALAKELSMRNRQRTLVAFGHGCRNAETQRASTLGPGHARRVTALFAALSLLLTGLR